MDSNDIILKNTGVVYLGVEKEQSSLLGKLAGELTICGEGSLILTPRGILFNRWLPPRKFFIDIKQIEKVELSSRHLFKPVFPGKVLRIFYNDKGTVLIFGIWMGIKDGTKWKGKIEEIVKQSVSDLA